MINESTKRQSYVFAFDPKTHYMMLSSEMVQGYFGSPRITAWRVTNPLGFRKLQLSQGRNHKVSCFTKRSDLFEQMTDFEGSGGVLVKLVGDEVLKTAFSNNAIIDGSKRRWVDTSSMSTELNKAVANIKSNVVKRYFQKKKNIINWINQHDVKISNEMVERLSKDFNLFYDNIMIPHAAEFLESCDKYDIYDALTDYHYKIDKIFDKYKEEIMNNRSNEMKKSDNEIICKNISIVKVYVMRDKIKEFEEMNPGWNPIPIDTKSLKLIKM